MNALPQSILDQPHLRFERMDEACLDEVMAIEMAVFPFYWMRKVFQSSLQAGYDCWVARADNDQMLAYFVLMKVVDEVHLLTIAVHQAWQGRGIARRLLERAIEMARDMGMRSMLLEVRPSNLRALEIYSRYGFVEIGRRKNYYEATGGTREDAIVMRLDL